MESEYVRIILTAFTTALITLILAYIAYCVKVESRYKDLEHEVKELEPLKKLLYQVGLEKAEKVFKGENK